MKMNMNLAIKMLFLFVVVFALAFSASAALDIVPTTTGGDLGSVADGAQKVGSMTVDNTDASASLSNILFSLNKQFALTPAVTGKANITAVTLPATISTLSPSDLPTVSFTVSVPIKSHTGTYVGEIKASDNAATPNQDVQAFQFTVPERLGISTSDSKAVLNGILVGKTSSAKLTIANEGNKELSITGITVPASLTIKDASGNILNTLDTSGLVFTPLPAAVPHLGSVEIIGTMIVPSTQAVGEYSGGNITVTFGSQTKSIPLVVKVATPAQSLSVPEQVKLGSASQKRKQNITGTFTITNNGDEPITEITVEPSSVSDVYHVQFKKKEDSIYSSTIAKFSLSKGISQDINVIVSIPEDQDSGARDIGDIIVKSKELSPKTISSFTLETKSMLKIVENIKAEYDSPDDDSAEDSFGNGGSIDNVLPGTDIIFSVNVKNDYSETDDYEKEIELRGVKVKIILKDVDDGSDLKETVSVGTLDPQEESGDEDIKFSLPREINEKTAGYLVLVEVTGNDKNDATHKVEWTAKLDITKHDDFIEITKASFADGEVQIGDIASLDFEIQNMGEEKEEEAEVEIICKDLGIDKVYTEDDTPTLSNNVLNAKSKWKQTFEVPIKDSYKPGKYTFTIKSFYDIDSESDVTDVVLTIKEKTAAAPASTAGSNAAAPSSTGSASNVPPAAGQTAANAATSASANQPGVIIGDASFTDSTAYYVLLGVIGLILLAILVLLVVKFFV